MEWHIVLLAAVTWEIVYHISKAYCARRYAEHPKAAAQGGGYVVAFLNACVCTIGGAVAVTNLLYAEEAERALVFTGGPNDAAGSFVYFTALGFLGYLISDFFHVLTHFPEYGGYDMVAHHICFFLLTCLGCGYRICPFVVGWLLLGEVSSLFLNYRWLLINTGRGNTRALTRTNYAFAVTFFIFRVLIFWVGLAHAITTERPFLIGPPRNAPPLIINLMCGFITLGACLNAFWMRKIITMATRPTVRPGEKCGLPADPRTGPPELGERSPRLPPRTPSATSELGGYLDSPLESPV